jgi:tetratricopeptide (TPR) repeat protein
VTESEAPEPTKPAAPLPRRFDPSTLRVPPRPSGELGPLPPLCRLRGLPGGVLLPADPDAEESPLVSPDGILGEAERLLGEANPTAVLELLEGKTDLDEAEVAALRTRAFLMDGRVDEARAALGDRERAGAALGDAALSLAEGDVERAARRVDEVRAANAASLGAAYVGALVEVARGDMQTGADLLVEVAKSAPSHAVARFQLGQIFYAQGDPARAGTLYEMAAQLAPRFVSPPLALADMLVESRQYGEALSILQTICDAAPNSLPPRQLQLRILVEIGERDAALDLGRKLHAQVPDDADTLLLYADALVDAERGDEARALLKDLLAGPADSAPAVRAKRLLARVALAERKPEEALRTLKEAAEVAPPPLCGEVCLELIHVAIAQHNLAEADAGLVLLLRAPDVGSLVSGALLGRQHQLPSRARALAERARDLVEGTPAAGQLQAFIDALAP